MKVNSISRAARRAYTRDNAMVTFDAAAFSVDSRGNHRGVRFSQNGRPMTYYTHDGRTVDSTGAFLVGELERLDLTLHMPLVAVSFDRDTDLRSDVTIGDEVSSFTTSTFASAGGLGAGNSIGTGKAWTGKVANQVTNVSVDIGKTPQPLYEWALELKYTIFELESAARVGRPIDAQKFEALKLKHQMDIDEMVYIGDTTYAQAGLVNSSAVTAANVVAGAAGFTFWAQKTPDEILADVNTLLTSVWAASAYAQIPNRMLLPPVQFGQIATQKVSQAGNLSVLQYLKENNLFTTSAQGEFLIFPSKWLVGAAAGGTIGTANQHDRMMAYTKQYERVRYPMTLLQRTPVQFDSIYHKTTYFCRLGVMEFVYPETLGYADLI